MASSQTTAASTPSISDQPITGTSLDFSLFFKATYPDEDTQNTTGGSPFLLASSKEALIAALDATDDTSNDQLFAQFYDTLHDAGQTTRTDEAHQRRRASRRGNRILENFTGWQHI
ncbi:hypothetical protein RAB80_014322, partial [Fusarium oxysporum f. sp. vasinfectum]